MNFSYQEPTNFTFQKPTREDCERLIAEAKEREQREQQERERIKHLFEMGQAYVQGELTPEETESFVKTWDEYHQDMQRQRLIQQHQQEMQQIRDEARRQQQRKQRLADLDWENTWQFITVCVFGLLMFAVPCYYENARTPTFSASVLPAVVLPVPEEPVYVEPAFAEPQLPTTPPQVVVAPAPAPVPSPTNLFAFDAALLAQSMTPARLNETQATALFKVISLAQPAAPPTEKESCDEESFLCRLSVAAKTYLPAFLQTYILGDTQEQDDIEDDAVEPFDYFDWVITVCDQAIFDGTTPAFLLNGPTTEESAAAFYQMTLGHFRKVKKYESAAETALKDLFVLDADLLEQSMTPARLTEVQGQALFDALAPVEDEQCCPFGDMLCRLSAVAPKYIPEFLKAYLVGPPEDDKPIDLFEWVVAVWNQSIYRETTPAFLPSGPTDKDSGVSFYKLAHNPDPEEIDFYPQHLFEDNLEVCAESDSLFAIVRQVIYFGHHDPSTTLSLPSDGPGSFFSSHFLSKLRAVFLSDDCLASAVPPFGAENTSMARGWTLRRATENDGRAEASDGARLAGGRGSGNDGDWRTGGRESVNKSRA